MAVIILAAGQSSRMGQPKQLLKVGTTTLLNRVIELSKTVSKSTVQIVVGANAQQIKDSVTHKDVCFIENLNYKEGLSTSIVAGVKANLDADAILVLLADQPNITTDYLKNMIVCFQEMTAKIIATNYTSRRGVPAIFPKSCFNDLLLLKGDKGAQELLNASNDFVVVMQQSVDVVDLDTPEDYLKYTR